MPRYINWSIVAIAIVLLLRLPAMLWLPLVDTSEPRYAEIARLMLVSGDYITPWFEPGVPFWGKPPLSFWTEALSMGLFGVNEFAVRLPSWIVTVLTVYLIFVFVKTFFTEKMALLASLIYASSGLIFISAGAVITDPFLTLGITLSLVALPLTIKTGLKCWQYGFFVGLAIGLLAKGPLALVLEGGVIAIWLLLQQDRLSLLKCFPWARGLLLTCVLSLPWYVAAEIKTPGFLNYFIVGEHFMRFIDPGWGGDLYGRAHRRPHGTIWLYWLASALPWSLALPFMTWSLFRKKPILQTDDSAYLKLPIYLILWALCIPVFFTAAGNILYTYAQPSLPAVSILIALWINSFNLKHAKSPALIAVVFTVLCSAALFATQYQKEGVKTEKALIAFVNKDAQATQYSLVYVDKRPFSARFYSKDTALLVHRDDLQAFLSAQRKVVFLAIPRENHDMVLPFLPKNSVTLYENRRYKLIKLNSNAKTENTNQLNSAGKDS